MALDELNIILHILLLLLVRFCCLLRYRLGLLSFYHFLNLLPISYHSFLLRGGSHFIFLINFHIVFLFNAYLNHRYKIMFCQHLMLEYLTKHLNDMLIHIDFDGEYHCHQQVRARANIEVCFVLVF
jgi:hypothetical protein